AASGYHVDAPPLHPGPLASRERGLDPPGGSGPSEGGYTWNIPPIFIASPMSPFSFSLPDMKAIWPESLPATMSTQSWAAIVNVSVGSVTGPAPTVHWPSLMMACQTPPWSPVISYWIVALTPAALSARNLLDMPSNVSFTVGIGHPPRCRGTCSRT